MNGTMRTTDGRYVLRFERRLAHPPEQVWRALTEPEQLAAWFPARIDGDRAPGAPLRFVMQESDDGGEGEVTEWDPPRLWAFTWGGEIQRWELQPDGAGGCLLVFTETGDDRPQGVRNAGGWHACLDALASLLDGEPLPWPAVHDAAIEHEGRYAEQFA